MHVVFVHGLRGDKERTWRASGKEAVFWPRWLEADLPGVAVWSIGYTAPATRWGGSAMYLPDAAENVLARMEAERRFAIGTIAFVAHSLGGLVVKQLIRSAERDASKNEARSNFLERIRKVAFLATPHSGADLAVFGNFLRAIVRPSEATAGLLRNDAHLRDLNRWYRAYATEHGIETLVLQEAHRTRFLGQIVKPDSSDPGLPDARLIPIEADHEAISKPTDRLSEVYIHLRDFLAYTNPRAHTRTQTASALSHLEATVTAGNERVLGAVKEALRDRDFGTRGSSASLADAEAAKRLSALRRSRFFVAFETRTQARRLADEMAMGELASASVAVKVETLAWCARLLAPAPTTEEAETILSSAPMAHDTNEVRVARALVTAARGNHAAALGALSELEGGLARTASLIVVTWERPPEDSIRWFQKAIGSFADLDPDGKLLLLRCYLELGRWGDALSVANSLSDEDFASAPALLQTAAVVHLVQVVAEELRPLILQQAPFNARSFPLAADDGSLAQRRRAQDLFIQGAESAYALGCHPAANVSADRALWLGLRDPDRQGEARKVLERSMSERAHALRRLPLALEFGLKLDLAAVERELDRESALSGGKSTDAAVARLAMAMTKDSEGEIADYIARHVAQLAQYYDSSAIAAIEIEMLARSGRPAEAEARVARLEEEEGFGPDGVAKLRQIIAAATAADPVQERIRQFEQSGQLADLLNLVHLLEERRDWKRLANFASVLFERTRDLPHAELLVHALTEEEDDERLLRLFEAHPDVLSQSDKLTASFSWVLYRFGRLEKAVELLGQLIAKRDDPNDRALLVNIAIASGEWNSLLTHIEHEWEKRGERAVEEIVRTAQLAQHVGSSRMTDLVREAAARAPDDPAVLSTCYSIATSAGLDEDAEVSSWMQRAVELSSEDGPVQRMSLHELMARQPDWQRRESETWDQLTEGQLPLFGAARLLNRSLADIYLRSALTNASQGDVRKRSVVLSYSGSRSPAGDEQASIALDPTALLTLGLLGVTERVLKAHTRVFIPHSTLGWLLEERQRGKFHQPSRVKEARELQLLLGIHTLKPLEPSTKADSDLVAEIDDDLAAMIAEAEAETDDGKQRVVVRPFPVYRAGSLMEEPADLTKHHKALCGCWEVVEALKRLGHITAVEDARAQAYLKLHEQRWPHETVLEKGAILYLDDLAVSYLHHLGLLPKLATAQFVPIISQSRTDESQALLLFDAVADQAGAILEEIRRCLSEGIKAGSVRLGHISRRDDSDSELRHHPSMGVFSLASEAEALVIDDRSVNRHLNIQTGSALRPILTTLDLLRIMHSRGVFSTSELVEFCAKLRIAGLALMPVDAAELISLLAACPVNDGVLSESAELRGIRESILRVRMTNILQLPQEHRWLETLLRAWIDALRAQWVDGIEEEDAAARSDWLLRLVDLRGWSHRRPSGGALSLWEDRCRAQMMLLMSIAHDQSKPVRLAYWRWLERAVIAEMKHRDPEAYAWLVLQTGERIDEMVVEFAAREYACEQ